MPRPEVMSEELIGAMYFPLALSRLLGLAIARR